MNNIFVLVKAQLLGVFGINAAWHSKDRAAKIKLLGLGLLIGFGMLSILVTWTLYCILLGDMGEALGLPELTIGITFGTASAFCLMTTLYKGCSLLFLSEDYEMLMPLPIQTWGIIVSKLFALYGMNFIFTLAVTVPAFAVYAVHVNPPVLFYLYACIGILLLPVIPIIVGTAFGMVITSVASVFKGKNTVNLLLSCALLLGIFAFSFSLQNTNMAQITNLSSMLFSQLNRIYPLTLFFVNGVCHLDLLSFVGFVLLNMALLGLFSWLIGKNYLSIHARLTGIRTGKTYIAGTFKVQSPLLTLYKKEMRRYFSSPNYVMNTAVSLVLLLGGSVALLLNKQAVLAAFALSKEMELLIPVLAPILISGLIAMCNPTCISISLEGKSLPILKGLPVSVQTIFTAKSLMTLSLTVPAILVTVPLVCYALNLDFFSALMCLLLPLSFAFFAPLFGLIVNLFLPTFDWVNEITVVKQSMASFIGMMGGVLLAFAGGFVVSIVPPATTNLTLICLCILFFLTDILLWLYLKIRGEKIFYSL